MELRQLRYFLAIAEHGNMSRAAKALYVAQSALSHQIAQLEHELDTTLFHRMPRGVELTETGHIFLAHAAAVLRQLDEAKASVHGTLGQPKGRVNVGLPTSMCNALAVPLIHHAKQSFPGISLELTEAASGDLAYMLKSGFIHLAVLFDDGEVGEFDTTPLAKERLYLIARENEENRNFGPTVTLEQALHLPLFLASPKQGVRRIVELTAKRHGMPPPNVIGDINSVSIMRSTLLVGLGYTLLPPMPFKQEIEQKLLKAWPIREPCLYRHVMIGALKGVPLTPATRAILQLARQVARQLSLSGEWLETSPME